MVLFHRSSRLILLVILEINEPLDSARHRPNDVRKSVANRRRTDYHLQVALMLD
jgi:hypothetical protein